MDNDYVNLQQTKSMGKGLFAKADIPSQTVILSIEEDEYITYQHLCNHPLFSQLQDELNISKLILFAFYLAYCSIVPHPTHHELSIKEYSQQLPQLYNNLICWHHSEINIIRHAKIRANINKRRICAWVQYLKIKQFAVRKLSEVHSARINEATDRQESKRTTRARSTNCFLNGESISNLQLKVFQLVKFEQILKYVSAVESRNVYYQTYEDNKSEVGALIPCLEFFNHREDANCEVEQTSICYKVRTVKPVKKGEQVFVNYGQMIQIDQFLEFYGMIPNDLIFSATGSDQESEKVNPAHEKCSPQADLLNCHQERMSLALMYNCLKEKSSKAQIQSPHPIKSPPISQN